MDIQIHRLRLSSQIAFAVGSSFPSSFLWGFFSCFCKPSRSCWLCDPAPNTPAPRSQGELRQGTRDTDTLIPGGLPKMLPLYIFFICFCSRPPESWLSAQNSANPPPDLAAHRPLHSGAPFGDELMPPALSGAPLPLVPLMCPLPPCSAKTQGPHPAPRPPRDRLCWARPRRKAAAPARPAFPSIYQSSSSSSRRVSTTIKHAEHRARHPEHPIKRKEKNKVETCWLMPSLVLYQTSRSQTDAVM